jgi:hypothetical protein
MGERRTLKLTPSNRALAIKGVEAAIVRGVAEDAPWTLELRQRTRTDDQNAALHGLITQILKQRPHHHGMKMSKEAYKAIFMHALGREQKMLPNLDGDGFFPMGLSTSKLTVSDFADLIEFILAWCAREGLEIKHFDDGRDREEPKKPSRRAA